MYINIYKISGKELRSHKQSSYIYIIYKEYILNWSTNECSSIINAETTGNPNAKELNWALTHAKNKTQNGSQA